MRAAGVIESDVQVFVTIDQFEALQRQSEHDGCDRRYGRFVDLVFELLSSRDPRVSYRIGTRPNGIIRSADSARDYAEVNLDGMLRRKEGGKKKWWLFQQLAEDAFRRRLAVSGLPFLSDVISACNPIRYMFGASPKNHDRGNRCASRKPERVIRCEKHWSATICAAIESLVAEDPVAAKLAEAWVRQKFSGAEELRDDEWKAMEDRPWENSRKRWWKKERAAQVALQVASSNAQRLLFYGEEDILTLSGENILAFISICRSIWECDARHRTEQRTGQSVQKFSGFDEVRQAQGIREASELWHRKIQQCADGDTLQRLMDVLGQRLNRQLIEDRSMSYPGANGISLAVEDLSTDDVIRKLLNDATAECLLMQLDHIPKVKSRGRSLKWYPHPLLAPYYGLTISRTKEPLYLKLRTLRKWLQEGQVIAVEESESARALQGSEASRGESTEFCEWRRLRHRPVRMVLIVRRHLTSMRITMPESHQLRPFGPLKWILNRLHDVGKWSVIGSFSAEDRCVAAPLAVAALKCDTDVRMLDIRIESRPTSRYVCEFMKKKEKLRATAIQQLTGRLTPIENVCLTDEDSHVINLASEICNQLRSDVILDVSTMPKRFLFPLLTLLCEYEAPRFRNLLITNSAPLRYGEQISGGWQDWKPLPMYTGDPFESSAESRLIVGVGYQLLSIQQILERTKSASQKVSLLLPFPSIHPGLIANWKFIEHIVDQRDDGVPERRRERTSIERVPISDVSLSFDRLVRLTEKGKTESLILAPFGPKPLSVAMCLLGIARRRLGYDNARERFCHPTEIGYTQPMWYHPAYTTGIRQVGDEPEITAFCVRLNGADLYGLG